jgi:hypothetical protein
MTLDSTPQPGPARVGGRSHSPGRSAGASARGARKGGRAGVTERVAGTASHLTFLPLGETGAVFVLSIFFYYGPIRGRAQRAVALHLSAVCVLRDAGVGGFLRGRFVRISFLNRKRLGHTQILVFGFVFIFLSGRRGWDGRGDLVCGGDESFLPDRSGGE